MDKPSFITGSEERFAKFISNLNDKGKIALLSHNDLDGVAAAKIVREVLNPDEINLLDYSDLNESLLKRLKQSKFNKIIITDLAMDSPDFMEKVEKFAESLYIDHHQFPKDFNSDKTIYINAQGFCATYLSYYLLSKIKDIEKFDWLVACATLSDYMLGNKIWLEEVFKKYESKETPDPNKETGKFHKLKKELDLGLIYCRTKDIINESINEIGKSFGEIGKLKTYSDEVEKELKLLLSRFEKEKEEINSRIVWTFTPEFRLGSKLSNLISYRNRKKTVIFIRSEGDECFVSARRQDGKEDMNKLLKKILEDMENAGGGGHIPAAGGHFMRKDLKNFKEKLKIL